MNKKFLWLLLIPAAALAAGGVYYSQQADYYKEHFYANTSFGDLAAGGLTSEEVHEVLKDSLADYQLTIKGNDTEDVITAEDIELHYDITAEDGSDVIDAALAAQEPWKWIFRKDAEYSYDGFDKVYEEDTLDDLMKEMSCVSPKKKIKAKNAYVEFDEENVKYVIIPDEDSNAVQKKLLRSQLTEALATWETEIQIPQESYKHAKVREDDASLQDFIDETEKYLQADITLVDGDDEVEIDRDVIIDFLTVDTEALTVTLDESAVRHYINTKLDGTFDTVGKERTVKTVRSGSVTISGGTYGKIVSTADELPKLMEEIENGETVEREPIYRQEERASSNGGFGDTYVDVNISTQTLSYVKNGEEILVSSVVTGLPKDGRETPTGCYFVALMKTEYTMVKYDAFVHYWMNIYPAVGVGFHDATWRSSFGGNIYKSNGSHGCINMPLDKAKALYENINWGTPVIVHY